MSHVAMSVYLLPGRARDPQRAVAEAVQAELAGFDGVWVSERWDHKDVGVVCGAVIATTRTIQVGPGVTHWNTRHPLLLASMALTAQTMSDGRFMLGLGRGFSFLSSKLGLPTATLASLEHLVSIINRLWEGERISESGAAGTFEGLRFVDPPTVPRPPYVLAAVGPKGLDCAGRLMDGVMLHPFLTVEATQRSVAMVREAAERAGRDPASVRVYSTLVTGPDVAEERAEELVLSRAISYLQARGLGEQIVEWNGWDPSALDRIRNHESLASRRGLADANYTRPELMEVGRQIPEEWIRDGGAIGSSRYCAQRALDYIEAGADEILIHGASPYESTELLRLAREMAG